MIRLSLLLFLSFLCTCVYAQMPLSIEVLETSAVAEDGLYFTGERGVGYQFGRRITPHGDCIDVVGGYQFVTWYKGGMDNRSLMLSRRRDEPGAEWVHLQFPHRHLGHQQDTTRGDSHNVAVIGVSTADSTIHLIYDIHAFRASSYGDDHFNYTVSFPGTAFVPDEAFRLDLFQPKRSFLRVGVNYERTTYPSIRRAPDGSLVARYRLGGSGNGDIAYATYQDGEWSSNQILSDGTIELPFRHNVYSTGERFFNERLHACFQIRYATNSDLRATFSLNRGLYWAYAEPPYGPNDWRTTNGEPLTIPFGHPDVIEIGTPNLTYGTTEERRSTIYPKFVETKAGAMHAIVRVDNTNVHYWKRAQDTSFSSATGGMILTPNGMMVNYNGYIIVVDRRNDRLIFRAAPEGTNDWTTLLQESTGPEYRHFNGVLRDDKLYLYLMEEGSSSDDAQPLRVKTYQLSGGTSSAQEPNQDLAPLRVFPNPTTGLLNIPDTKIGSDFSVFTAQGQHLQAGKISGNTIGLGDLAPGTYFLRVSNREGKRVSKIIIQ
ncbi:MAG: BNR-4 repeat-containing protein [Bacteroidota bacterium]